MKIISYLPDINNIESYYKEIYNSNFEGIFINVILKDNYDIDVYSKDEKVKIKLEDFINKFKDYKKIIIMNLVLNYITINDTDIKKVTETNQYFVKRINEILSNYNLNIYLATFNEGILYFLQNTYTPHKIGTIVTRENLNFVNVDFYMFEEYYANLDYINELMQQKKEIMIFTNSIEKVKEFPYNVSFVLESSS